MQRNNNNLENKRVEKQHKLRKYWKTHKNFVTMHGCVYGAIVYAKVATPMYESYYYFIHRPRRRVKTEEEAAGHQIRYHLSHPQYVLFGD